MMMSGGSCILNIKMASMTALVTVIVIFVITSSQGSNIVERDEQTTLHCVCPSGVNSITWKLVVEGNSTVDLSTCTLANSSCTSSSSLYQGSLSGSGANIGMDMNVTSARINETEFLCIGDNDTNCTSAELEVFEWPSKPTCTQIPAAMYIAFLCQTENAYPAVEFVAHRRGRNFSQLGITIKTTPCKLESNTTTGIDTFSCVFLLPINNMPLDSQIYVEMSAVVSNKSAIQKTPVVSDDVNLTLSVPTVGVNEGECPYGSGVVNGDYIRNTGEAYCRCVLTSPGNPEGYARWYTPDGALVAVNNRTDGSSILTIYYNLLDPNASYECRPVTYVNGNVTYYTYKPKFIAPIATTPRDSSTSFSPSYIIIVLGALYSGIVSYLA